ncbi:MAG: acyl-CoA synthetase, partial [Acinetobacter guillouiae]
MSVQLYNVVLTTRLKLPEVLYIVEDCDAKIIILSAQYCTQELVDAIQQLEKKPIIFVLDDSNVSGIIKLDSLLKMASIQVNRTLLEGNEM